MSGSFGSAHRLTDLEVASLRLHRKTFSFPGNVRDFETTPLLSPSGPRTHHDEETAKLGNAINGKVPAEPRMSWSLLITILVVTVGSSLQFG